MLSKIIALTSVLSALAACSTKTDGSEVTGEVDCVCGKTIAGAEKKCAKATDACFVDAGGNGACYSAVAGGACAASETTAIAAAGDCLCGATEKLACEATAFCVETGDATKVNYCVAAKPAVCTATAVATGVICGCPATETGTYAKTLTHCKATEKCDLTTGKCAADDSSNTDSAAALGVVASLALALTNL